ncbi:MAG: hypothetical protein NTU53_03610 [Planctomycetota bacterium]|nr:hypothetical protein [Planctomycetota bacterium]
MDAVVDGSREAENRSHTMVQNVKIEVAALRRMSPAELREAMRTRWEYDEKAK